MKKYIIPNSPTAIANNCDRLSAISQIDRRHVRIMDALKKWPDIKIVVTNIVGDSPVFSIYASSYVDLKRWTERNGYNIDDINILAIKDFLADPGYWSGRNGYRMKESEKYWKENATDCKLI